MWRDKIAVGIYGDEEMTVSELQELMNENEKFLLGEIQKMKKEKYMSKYGEVEFKKEVSKAYDILWKMYRPEGGCNWDSMQESMLLSMINCIDDVMGWEDNA